MAFRHLRWPLRAFCRGCRGASGGLKPWTELSEPERAAWEVLGYGKAWHQNPRPPRPLPRWSELQAHQQAAAKHGLQLHEESWEKLRILSHSKANDVDTAEGAHETKASAVSALTVGGGLWSGAAGAAWSVCKRLAPVVGDALDGARHPALRMLGGALRSMADVTDSLTASVTVDGLETILYLDDSGSMRSSVRGVFGKSGLQLGQDVLDQALKPKR